ncbi:MAG: hypothetical protein RLZZ360_397 [Candidatus Parcubacteria bacterium]|jgi:hypothetical protein
MQQTTESTRLFETVVLTLFLGWAIKSPFIIIFLLINAEALLWLGEFYSLATFAIGIIAVSGLIGVISQERALAVCRAIYLTLYVRPI